MKIKTMLAGIAATMLVTSALYADPAPTPVPPPVSIQQFEQTQRGNEIQTPRMLNLSTNTEAPEIYPGENSDVGPQRILRAAPPRKTWFEVVADSQYLYSDNLFLSDSHKIGGPIFVNTIQAAFAPQAYALGSGKFAPAIGYRSQWFNYGLGGRSSLNALDFNAQTAFINARYQKNNWQVYGGFDFTRLLGQPDYIESYREFVPTLGAQRIFPIGDKVAISVGAQVSYHFTETPKDYVTISNDVKASSSPPTDANDRFDASLLLSLSWAPTPKLVVQPFYRFQYTYYPHFLDLPNDVPGDVSLITERNDTINTMGVNVIYYFTKNISARAFANYEIRDNDYLKSYSYHKLDTGGGLSLDIRF